MSVLPSLLAATVLCEYKMESLNVRVWRMPNRVSSATAPESARIMQVLEDIGKRQLLNVFEKTSDHPVRDLSNEALLIEYAGHLTDY
jgi:hypothetical protein